MMPMLGGRYQLSDLLASGDIGMVWRAMDRGTGRTVAVKVLHPHLAADPRLADRFLRARRELTALWHPGIARLLDIVVEDDTLALVSDLVAGADLRRWSAMYGPMTAAAARDIAESIADALSAAHRLGIVHGDVKPSNVVIPPPGEGPARLTDFSVAVLVRAGRRHPEPAEPPWYRAPEVTDGVVPASSSDVYALGAVLADMLTGGPWAAERDGSLLFKLRDVAVDCMRPDPGTRPTAAQVVEDLRHMVGRPGTALALPAGPAQVLELDPDRAAVEAEWEDVLKTGRLRRRPRRQSRGPAGPDPTADRQSRGDRPAGLLRRPAGIAMAAAALLVAIAVAVPITRAIIGPSNAAQPPPAQRSAPAAPGVATQNTPPRGGTAPAVPRLPSAARERSQQGGAEFVRYWFSTFNTAVANGEVAELSRLTAPGCGNCQEGLAAIRSGYANGGALRGGAYVVRKITTSSLWTSERPVFDATVDRSPRSAVDSAGAQRDSLPALTFVNCVVILEWTADGWRMLEVPTSGCVA